ncbi:MAG: GyrI-like domain-containing protein, partial [Alphaproteobacteria bacterium]|nr:GyrI-like domain-containing protein [Alphaproteobacteria bacterium]
MDSAPEDSRPDDGKRDETLRRHLLQIARAVSAVMVELDGEHAVAALAARAHMSPFHFLRVFKSVMRLTPDAFVRRLRLQRAAWQLVTREDQVIDVALAAGFDSPDGFARAFRRLYGVTPSQFRQVRGDPWSICGPGAYWRPPPQELFANHRSPVMEIDIRSLPAILYAAVRAVGPYNAVGPAFKRIIGWAAQSGLMTPQAKVIGLSYDNPKTVPAHLLRYDAGVTLARRVPTPPDISIRALPACRWAMAQHRGTYATLPATFQALFAAVEARPDLAIAMLPPLEIYLNDPADTPPEALLTDIG